MFALSTTIIAVAAGIVLLATGTAIVANSPINTLPGGKYAHETFSVPFVLVGAILVSLPVIQISLILTQPFGTFASLWAAVTFGTLSVFLILVILENRVMRNQMDYPMTERATTANEQ